MTSRQVDLLLAELVEHTPNGGLTCREIAAGWQVSPARIQQIMSEATREHPGVVCRVRDAGAFRYAIAPEP